MQGEGIAKPVFQVHQDQGQDSLPSEEPVKAVGTRGAKRSPRDVDNSGGYDNKEDCFQHGIHLRIGEILAVALSLPFLSRQAGFPFFQPTEGFVECFVLLAKSKSHEMPCRVVAEIKRGTGNGSHPGFFSEHFAESGIVFGAKGSDVYESVISPLGHKDLEPEFPHPITEEIPLPGVIRQKLLIVTLRGIDPQGYPFLQCRLTAEDDELVAYANGSGQFRRRYH